jgi:hypothetical protein
VERLASELIELSARYTFACWLPGANVLRGWARSVSGDTSEGISWIERGVEDYRASGSTAGMPLWLADTSKEKPHLRLIARRWLVLVTASMGLYLVLPELWVGPE